MWICAQRLFPNLPRNEAMCATGRKVAEGYSHTTMGKALFDSLRKLGSARTRSWRAR